MAQGSLIFEYEKHENKPVKEFRINLEIVYEWFQRPHHSGQGEGLYGFRSDGLGWN